MPHYINTDIMEEQIPYSIKVWQVEESLANHLRFAKVKPSKVVVNNPMANLFIRQTFFCQTLEKSKFATKFSARKTFPLYGKLNNLVHRIPT